MTTTAVRCRARDVAGHVPDERPVRAIEESSSATDPLPAGRRTRSTPAGGSRMRWPISASSARTRTASASSDHQRAGAAIGDKTIEPSGGRPLTTCRPGGDRRAGAAEVEALAPRAAAPRSPTSAGCPAACVRASVSFRCRAARRGARGVGYRGCSPTVRPRRRGAGPTS